MKITFCAIGKNHDPAFKATIDDFTKRIGHYIPLEWKILPQPKVSGKDALMKAEAALILKSIQNGDFIVALDEHGKQMDSLSLASFIEQLSVSSTKNLVFVIGGAYGMHAEVLNHCQFKWSLSKLTFPHQLVRLILAEQVYRACTILRNEKYHHG